jgi:hypothetical protein
MINRVAGASRWSTPAQWSTARLDWSRAPRVDHHPAHLDLHPRQPRRRPNNATSTGAERLGRPLPAITRAHCTYLEAMNVALGSVSVVASTRPEVADGFAPCQSMLDRPIVRALALHDATSLCTVATAAAPENGAGYAV